MKIIFFSVFLFVLGCTTQNERTDEDMFELANGLFKDYLFEIRADSKLFAKPVIVEHQNGIKSYRWIAISSGSPPVGGEIHVSRAKNTEPEWIQIGSFDDWRPFMGTAPSPPENKIYDWFFWENKNRKH